MSVPLGDCSDGEVWVGVVAQEELGKVDDDFMKYLV